jgi:hypothetical protein
MSTLTTPGYLARYGFSAALALCVIGCGPDFDPPSKLQSLRILAVKKDKPYVKPTAGSASTSTDAAVVGAGTSTDAALPDNTVRMTLAMEDARIEADKQQTEEKPIQKLWFAGCTNPADDNYFSCLLNVWMAFKAFTVLGPGTLSDGQTWSLEDVRDEHGNRDDLRICQFVADTFPSVLSRQACALASLSSGTESTLSDDLFSQALAIKIGAGDTFEYTVPSWAIDKHEPPAQSTIPRYGMSEVFVAVCDGEIGISPGWETVSDPFAVLTDATRGFPLTCRERGTAKERGPDNFAVAYSNIYVYDELSNKNPTVSGVDFDASTLTVDPAATSALCIGEACIAAQEKEEKARQDEKDEHGCMTDGSAFPVDRCVAESDDDCRDLSFGPVVEQDSEIDYIASHIGGGDDHLFEQMWIRYFADHGKIKNDTKRLQDANEGWFAEHKTKWTIPRTSGPAHIWTVVYDNRGGVEWARLSVCVR